MRWCGPLLQPTPPTSTYTLRARTMPYVNCHKEVKSFHANEVTLPNEDQGEMRDRRDAGRDRLKGGLTKVGHEQPSDIQAQGSYAMRTMIQDDECDYDIDDGVYFEKADLRD